MKMITPGFLVCAVDCHGNPWDHGMLIFVFFFGGCLKWSGSGSEVLA